MILSHKEIEEIAAAVTEDFNEFFFGSQVEEVQAPRATPIDQLAKDYLGLTVSFAKLSKDGSICGLTAYADTEYAVEEGGACSEKPSVWKPFLMADSIYSRSVPTV